MTTGSGSSAQKSLRGYARRKLAPMVEIVESRLLLDAGVGLIAGSVYLDANKNALFDDADTPLPGVTVELYKVGDSTPTSTTQTDATGRYSFSGVASGDYVLKQVAPSKSQVIANRVQSDLYPTSSIDPQSLSISVPDSDKVYVNYGGVDPSAYLALNNVVNGVPAADATGLLRAGLGTAPGVNDLNPSLPTFCLDDLDRLTFEGGESFGVLPTSITSLSNENTPVPASRSGRIAFLYNHFGHSSLTNIQAAGLQLAMWELLYDTGDTADFSSGNFQSLGPLNPADQDAFNQAIVQATEFFNASIGQSEPALLLYANAPLGTPPAGVDGFQSMIARSQFDFLNTPDEGGEELPKAAISGYVYCDANDDGIKQSSEPGISSVVVTLTGTNDLGQPVYLTTTTDATGFYNFPDLRPGTYTITETQPEGYVDGKDTQGTPGTGVTGQDTFRDIVLVDQDNGENNNFGEHRPAPEVTQLTLYGIHWEPTCIVLNVKGKLDPAAATDPANYTLVALGHDEKLGTCDDRLIPIQSIRYDQESGKVVIVPSVHLNIHYHYLLATKVAASTSCARPLEYTSVFGRSSLAATDRDGKPYPVPRMAPCRIKYDQKVINRALNTWKATNGALPKKTAVIPHRSPVTPTAKYGKKVLTPASVRLKIQGSPAGAPRVVYGNGR
ncbi:MAG: SdrD B-like domain-containing protein [Isosphaeraceae bacterium]